MSIYIQLYKDEMEELVKLAQEEKRRPQDQAAYMVVQALKQRKRLAEMFQQAESAGVNPSQYTFPSDLDLQGQAIPVLKGSED